MVDMNNPADFMAKSWQAIEKMVSVNYDHNPRRKVYQYDKVKLYHYTAAKKQTETTPPRVPLLIVFATVNRPEILDLFPQQSFIRGLLDQGLDVYLLDWGYPDARDHAISIKDYVTNHLQHCVQFIKKSKRSKQINLLGICQGGLLSLCYTALFPNIKNLVLISTPVDFHTPDNQVTEQLQKLSTESLSALHMNIPGAWLTQFFISLKPTRMSKKYLRFLDELDDDKKTDKFLRMEKWLHDAPDQTLSAFLDLIKQYYQKNNLIKNKIKLGNKLVNLQNITVPILNVVATEDDIVPKSASLALKDHVGSTDYTACEFPSGHIGIYVSGKVGTQLTATIADWLKAR